ncbi:DUF6090 family protein [Maribacter antarcticus]|uniref:DUF6090 family protein n=1 Tax=Maribacter antarcticus TaxID=505250 RepID=UPI00047DE393|nr:DUF6090 family protein [Maribacter antarcticus]
MIKFFRKIRQNLLSQGKTGKYLKYAIGEIVLVVIGILLALSINNWNEERKEKLIIRNLLHNIRLDMQADTLQFSKNIKDIPEVIANATLLLNSTELDTLSANELFNNLPYYSFYYVINNKNYEKVINVGITDFYNFNELYNDINTYYTLDANAYHKIIKWDDDDTTTDGSLWLSMGFEIDIYTNFTYTENDVRFAQTEENRKTVFIEQLNKPQMRNSIKMSLYRKRFLDNILTKTKQRAEDIILKIDEQLRE